MINIIEFIKSNQISHQFILPGHQFTLPQNQDWWVIVGALASLDRFLLEARSERD